MPRYNYYCYRCKFTKNKFVKASEFNPEKVLECPECTEQTFEFILPKDLEAQNFTTNKYTGRSKKVGVEGQLRQRMKKHMAKYEYHEMVDRHGLDNTQHIIDKVKKV